MKDFWSRSMQEHQDYNRQVGRSNDEALVLSLIVLLLQQGKNSKLVMALLYILS